MLLRSSSNYVVTSLRHSRLTWHLSYQMAILRAYIVAMPLKVLRPLCCIFQTWPSSSEPEQEFNFSLADSEPVNLPPESFTRLAVSGFFSSAATLLYVMSEEASESLIRRVYHNSASANKSDICELCAIAAVGSQYITDGIPVFVK